MGCGEAARSEFFEAGGGDVGEGGEKDDGGEGDGDKEFHAAVPFLEFGAHFELFGFDDFAAVDGGAHPDAEEVCGFGGGGADFAEFLGFEIGAAFGVADVLLDEIGFEDFADDFSAGDDPWAVLAAGDVEDEAVHERVAPCVGELACDVFRRSIADGVEDDDDDVDGFVGPVFGEWFGDLDGDLWIEEAGWVEDGVGWAGAVLEFRGFGFLGVGEGEAEEGEEEKEGAQGHGGGQAGLGAPALRQEVSRRDLVELRKARMALVWFSACQWGFMVSMAFWHWSSESQRSA